MKNEALKLALAYIKEVDYGPYDSKPVITAIKQALAAPVQEPFWHAVVSEQAPVVDKAIRRLDIAEEYAAQCRPHYPGVEVVSLYRATPPAHPAVPDAIHHTDLIEHPQYIEGWNDCRAEMLKGMKP